MPSNYYYLSHFEIILTLGWNKCLEAFSSIIRSEYLKVLQFFDINVFCKVDLVLCVTLTK